MIKGILTPKEVAIKPGVTEPTVLLWREKGIPSIKLDKFIFIIESSLVKWMRTLENGQKS